MADNVIDLGDKSGTCEQVFEEDRGVTNRRKRIEFRAARKLSRIVNYVDNNRNFNSLLLGVVQ